MIKIIFEWHTHEINDGEWHDSSPMERAIKQAQLAAMSTTVDSFNASIMIRPMPCPGPRTPGGDAHRDLCWPFHITLFKEDE
jgi:hypothetical protein